MSRCPPFIYNGNAPKEANPWIPVSSAGCNPAACDQCPFPGPGPFPPGPCPCPNFERTLVSVRNPETQLIIPETTPVPPPRIDANAFAPLFSVGIAVDLALWTDIITDQLGAFDNVTGTYTAPEAGDYRIDLIVNYQASTSIPVSPTLEDVPSIEIYDVTTGNAILGSTMTATVITVPVPPPTTGDPPIDVTVAALTAKAIVAINAIIALTAGQRIRARACSNGLTYTPPTILPPPPPASIDFTPVNLDTTWTIVKLRNTPAP
jgi:hypothetical protein